VGINGVEVSEGAAEVEVEECKPYCHRCILLSPHGHTRMHIPVRRDQKYRCPRPCLNNLIASCRGRVCKCFPVAKEPSLMNLGSYNLGSYKKCQVYKVPMGSHHFLPNNFGPYRSLVVCILFSTA